MANKLPQTSSPSRRLFRGAFTLIEILVVVSIIAILIAILIPALAAAKAESETVACLANQRTIAQSLLMFAHQHNGYMVKGQNNGYGVAGNTTVSDGAYYGAPQAWGYSTNLALGKAQPLNWDQVLVVDKYVTFSVLQCPADESDDYLRTGSGQLRYSSLPGTPIASAQPYQNLPGSYRLNASNQPEDVIAAAPYNQPQYNAYAIASVNAPSQSIVLCDGGYDAKGAWMTTPDVATWGTGPEGLSAPSPASTPPYATVLNPNTPTSTDNIANISINIHSRDLFKSTHYGEFNVAFLDGHCQTVKWPGPDTWAPAGQPTIVPAASGAPAWADGGTAPITTEWRQVFSQDFPDNP